MFICLYRYIKSTIILKGFEKKILDLKQKMSDESLMYLEMTYDLLEVERDYYFGQTIKHIAVYATIIWLFYIFYKFWEFFR